MNNNKNTLVFDLDDTLCDLASPIMIVMNRITNKFIHYTSWRKYQIHELYGLTENEMMDILEKEKVLEQAVPFPHTKYVIDQLKDNNNIVIITARNWHYDARQLTENWLQKNNIYYDKIYFTELDENKVDILNKLGNVRAYVDDRRKHVENALLVGYNAFLQKAPWNEAQQNMLPTIEDIRDLLKDPMDFKNIKNDLHKI